MPSVKPHSDSKPRFFEVNLSDVPDLDRADLEILGEEIIDFIIERTLKGKNINNRPFGRYSDEYAEREGKDNPPDLNLSSDMLESLEVLKVMPTAKRVRIGYDTRYDGLGKVEGNVLGTYGQKSPIPGKKRDFLGISKSDLEKLLRAGDWL
jgi:hypothetical protein